MSDYTKCPLCGGQVKVEKLDNPCPECDSNNKVDFTVCTKCDYLGETEWSNSHTLVCDHVASLRAQNHDLLHACEMMLANIEKWRETGIPSSGFESMEPYDLMKAAVAKAKG